MDSEWATQPTLLSPMLSLRLKWPSMTRTMPLRAVSLDIKGAFDNVSYASIRRAMELFGFPKQLGMWYLHYLQNRIAKASVNGVAVKRKLCRGVPQGSILGPMLWNITFDELLAKYKPTMRVNASAFADDLCLITRGRTPRTLHKLIQQALVTASLWGQQTGLEFCAKKSVAMVFHRKNKPETFPPLLMDGS